MMYSGITIRFVTLSAVLALASSASCAAGHLAMFGDHHDGANDPVARISASVVTGAAPLAVDFDFSDSYCVGGHHTAHHYFDPGLGTVYAVDSGMHYLYEMPGVYHARLRITDGYGGSSSTEVLITAQ